MRLMSLGLYLSTSVLLVVQVYRVEHRGAYVDVGP
jgi:hypothetical protein